jgi:hypothetical protein
MNKSTKNKSAEKKPELELIVTSSFGTFTARRFHMENDGKTFVFMGAENIPNEINFNVELINTGTTERFIVAKCHATIIHAVVPRVKETEADIFAACFR